MLQYLGDPDVDGRITLKWLDAILNSWVYSKST